MKKTLQECKEIVAQKDIELDFEWCTNNLSSNRIIKLTDLANKMYYDQSEWISLERAKKYARHQHYLGSQGNELVEFEDWSCEPLPNPPQK